MALAPKVQRLVPCAWPQCLQLSVRPSLGPAGATGSTFRRLAGAEGADGSVTLHQLGSA